MFIGENIIAWLQSIDSVGLCLDAAGRLTVGNKGVIPALN